MISHHDARAVVAPGIGRQNDAVVGGSGTHRRPTHSAMTVLVGWSPSACSSRTTACALADGPRPRSTGCIVRVCPVVRSKAVCAHPGPRPRCGPRTEVVQRGLTATAIGALTETVRNLPLDALAPGEATPEALSSPISRGRVSDRRHAPRRSSGPGTGLAAPRGSTTTSRWSGGWEPGPFVPQGDAGGVGGARSPRRLTATGRARTSGRPSNPTVVPEVTPRSPHHPVRHTPRCTLRRAGFYSSGDEACGRPAAARGRLFEAFRGRSRTCSSAPTSSPSPSARPGPVGDPLLAPVLRGDRGVVQRARPARGGRARRRCRRPGIRRAPPIENPRKA